MCNNNTDHLKSLIEAEAQASRAGLKWAKANLHLEDLSKTRDTLIKGRVRIARINGALQMKPAVAVFGKSQVGKSYMAQNMLKNSKGILSVISDAQGSTRNFILELNPSGGGVESTSLITRFTRKATSTGNPDFPIAVKVFSPTDVALTMIDSYYSDVQMHSFPDKQAVEERIAMLEAKYAGAREQQTIIGEDQVYEMIDYITHGAFPIAKSYIDTLRATRYMERLSSIISAIPQSEWVEAMRLLWNDCELVSEVYVKLINLLQSMGNPEYVGINIDPLLKIDGTILCVDRIKEFFGVLTDEKGGAIEKARVQDMQVWTGSRVMTVPKSEFTSLATEVVLQVPEDPEAPKEFMDQLDVLDFPGARSRMDFKEAEISRANVCTMLLRGRVSYLFNKYSRDFLISSLLFCHDEKQADVQSLGSLLKNWISDMVGATPEARATYLAGTDVPPLFLISTKFNIDLERDYSKEPDGADEQTLLSEANHRWVRRYTNVLSEIIKDQSMGQWFSQWLIGKPFDNIYLLRDYTYSEATYSGYRQNTREDAPTPEKAQYLARLEQSFISHDFVKAHFRDPQIAWNRAALPNQDGADYIIENLVKASKHVVRSRDRAFTDMVADTFHEIYNTLFSFYHDDNSDAMLAEALKSAGRIAMTLDIMFGSKPYLFTELLSAMLVKEENLHGHILDVSHQIETVQNTDMQILFAIRHRAEVDPSLPYEQNLQRLLSTYEMKSEDELTDYLTNFGCTIQDIINPPAVQNLPRIVADKLVDYWTDKVICTDNLSRFTKEGIPASALQDIVSNMRALSTERLHLTEYITEHIRPLVSSPANLAPMAEMIADMVAEMFNKFVNTFGTAYFTPQMWEDINDSVKHNDFDLQLSPSAQQDTLDEEAQQEAMLRDINMVFDVFENIDTILNTTPLDSSKLAYFSNYNNYRLWTQNMKAGFLATCEIPKYDVNINNELRAILLRTIFDSKPLHSYVDADPKMQEAEAEMRAATRQ